MPPNVAQARCATRGLVPSVHLRPSIRMCHTGSTPYKHFTMSLGGLDEALETRCCYRSCIIGALRLVPADTRIGICGQPIWTRDRDVAVGGCFVYGVHQGCWLL